jgi:glycerol-3-phosphate dehydrogenase (NAD(P)+)
LKKIGILGAGSWGTALAKVSARQNREIVIWARDLDIVDGINKNHRNPTYLTDIELPPEIKATNDFSELCDVETLLLVTPAQKLRSILEQFSDHLPPWVPLVICSKGIEIETGEFLSEVVREVTSENPIAILSGPNFADETAKGLPTGTAIASKDRDLGFLLVESFGSKTFRPYYNPDIIGVQLAGALKNVYAIASGITAGKKLGENAIAALLTRSLAEMARLGIRLGGSSKTFMGLSGIGDLMLSCQSARSRNRTMGFEIGSGKTAQQVMKGAKSVFEGYYTSSTIKHLAKKGGVEMPVADAIYKILYEEADIDSSVAALLARPFGEEGKL